MDKYSYDMKLRKGTTFTNHLILQKAEAKYDPLIHTSDADKRRTHAENIAYYGHTYEYINVASLYHHARLKIFTQWDAPENPSFVFYSDKDSVLTCTDNGITINFSIQDINAFNGSILDYCLELCSDEHEVVVETVVCGKIFIQDM